MARKKLGLDVFNMAIDRLTTLYADGHRLVVSFSGGKDSTCVLNCALIAAKETGRLPVDVVMQDEEIAYPGTYEYAERIWHRKDEFNFKWLNAHQPMVNVYNRKDPYFWVFDQKLPPEKWFRQPPPFAEEVPHKDICMMTIPERWPVPPGKRLFAVMGLRTSESRGRMFGLFSSGGYITKPNQFDVAGVRPIYDWQDSDVWKAIKDNGWDYNRAYDTLYAMGVRSKGMRVAPPTANVAGVNSLGIAAAAWPKWFGKLCERLPGVRVGAQFGIRSISPIRRLGETWEQCFQRECVDEAPQWISERAVKVRDRLLSAHGHHSTQPLPESSPCYTCHGSIGSWKKMAQGMYLGDPFAEKVSGMLQHVEPEFFRPGAGTWLDRPTW